MLSFSLSVCVSADTTSAAATSAQLHKMVFYVLNKQHTITHWILQMHCWLSVSLAFSFIISFCSSLRVFSASFERSLTSDNYKLSQW